MTQRSTLVGRTQEQAVLAGLLESMADGLSGAIVLRGAPGVGKTALLDDLVGSAREFAVARLAGVESEGGLGYAALHRLLIPYLPSIDRLPEPQRQALRIALGLLDGPAGTPFLIGLAVLTLLADAAQTRPLMCVIDDAQWLDQESLEVFAFVARRLYADRLGLVFAVREPPRNTRLEAIPELPLAGLAPESGADLLVSLAPRRVDRQVALQLAEQADGNPLALTEVGRELSLGRLPPGLLLNQPIPVGQRLESHFERRVRELPSSSRALLLLAALDDDANVVWRAAGLAGLTPEAAVPAEAVQLVDMSPELRFRHPLVRSAVFAGAEPADRRWAHQLLARATDADHPDLRAWHWAGAAPGPDEQVAQELERCAQQARRRGGFLIEAEFLARAAELSVTELRAAGRTLAAATAAVTGGAPLRAATILDAGDRTIADPHRQAQAQLLRARIDYLSGRPLGEVPATLLSVAREFAPTDSRLTRRSLLDAVELAFVTGHFISGVTGAEVGRTALALLPEPSTDPGVDDLLLTGLATLAGVGYVEAAPLLQRAVTALADPVTLENGVPAWFFDGAFAAHALWDDRARRDWLERCERTGRATGVLHLVQLALASLSIVQAQTGHLDSAEALTEDSRQLARGIGRSEAEMAVMVNPELLAWRGRDEAAVQAAATAAAAAEYLQAADINRPGYAALMVMHLGRGRYLDAFQVASRMRAEDSVHFDNESLPNLVEAGVRSDHRETAAEALAELTVRATASGTHWALGLLARSQALMATDPEPLYLTSIRHLEQTTVLTDLARAHLLYGEWLRRQNRRLEARVPLRSALDIFSDMGAPTFARRARSELTATGARLRKRAPGRVTELTSQEARIARLAADGATNQAIAGQLFISSHTVGYHLSKAFRKLGVTSRQQLPVVLGP